MEKLWKYFWGFNIFIGCIPILCRIFASLLSNGGFDCNYIFNAIDISLLGLAMNWTNINEVQHLVLGKKKQKSKLSDIATLALSTATIGLIFCLAGLIFVLYLAEIGSLNNNIPGNALWLSITLTLISIVLSFFFVRKLNSI